MKVSTSRMVRRQRNFANNLLLTSSRFLQQSSNLVLHVNTQCDLLQLGDLRASLAEYRDTSSIYRPTSSENTSRLSGAAFEQGMEPIHFHHLFSYGIFQASRTPPCQTHCLDAVCWAGCPRKSESAHSLSHSCDNIQFRVATRVVEDTLQVFAERDRWNMRGL